MLSLAAPLLLASLLLPVASLVFPPRHSYNTNDTRLQLQQHQQQQQRQQQPQH
jgi:hypothetical protein